MDGKEDETDVIAETAVDTRNLHELEEVEEVAVRADVTTVENYARVMIEGGSVKARSSMAVQRRRDRDASIGI